MATVCKSYFGGYVVRQKTIEVKNLGWLLANRSTCTRVIIENTGEGLILVATGGEYVRAWKYQTAIADETVMYRWVERYMLRQCNLRPTYNYRTDGGNRTDTMPGTMYAWKSR